MQIKHLIYLLVSMILLLSCDNSTDVKKEAQAHKATKNSDAKPVIWIGDFNNFDDTLALMLVAKDPRYTIELVVVEESFNNIAQGVNTTYSILEWLGNLDTKIIRGAYFAQEEISMGANGKNAQNTAVNDSFSPTGKNDYQIPNSSDFSSGKWNLERRNVMGINLFGQYVPGPWRDNGASLYGTSHMIPHATQKGYFYKSDRNFSFNYTLSEDTILQTIDKLDSVIILNTGKMTTMSRLLAKATASQLSAIQSVYIMGSGFEGHEPFTSEHNASCYGDKSRNHAGHIFSHPSFNCESDFSTYQEFNVFLDPKSAQETFDMLSSNNIQTWLIPTNATDLAKVEAQTIAKLANGTTTPEANYASKLFGNIREFEGGDFNGNGDFALDAVIRLWDVVAALVLLEPELSTHVEKAFIEVNQLDEGLEQSDTPYDPLTFDPMVGKTTMVAEGKGSAINVVLKVDVNATRDAMITRLRSKENQAVKEILHKD